MRRVSDEAPLAPALGDMHILEPTHLSHEYKIAGALLVRAIQSPTLAQVLEPNSDDSTPIAGGKCYGYKGNRRLALLQKSNADASLSDTHPWVGPLGLSPAVCKS